MTAGHVSRRKSTALPMLATWCPPPLEHRDSRRLLSTRRLESRAVEPTQRTTAKPMRRGHWRQSAMPGVCQQSHVRSLGHSALATSARRLPNALEQRKRLAAAVPRRKPHSAMLTVARTTPQQDAQRFGDRLACEPTIHNHCGQRDSPPDTVKFGAVSIPHAYLNPSTGIGIFGFSGLPPPPPPNIRPVW